ncbi:Hydrogenase expression/formation protein HypE [Caloramator mitchellensis]|uniref:Hydrogenase expression/formation protein HypE n=1 Tax=Caloramator mitchellensis TaxID=908809 RepID=A0A0R3JSX1_CALMK|nr:hydrogenase expression/formation protein HypE [Caloramator mitchellensis]KRQ86614.1 Hydrogenase expression/formation protein HypE [Caloramator mitchellensis]
MDDIITLDYGSGGKKTSQLIDELILKNFNNSQLLKLMDGAILPIQGHIAFSTDSFVVAPYFFPGGDIGKLSVCGTVNDLLMCGAIPKYLSLSLIIEEGFKTNDLSKILLSIRNTAIECGVNVVTGDTKVVEKGKGDGIYINTAGIGVIETEHYGKDKIEEGDAVIITGFVGDHGIAVMSARNNFFVETDIISDCMPLINIAKIIFKYGTKVKIMRDPTRGGLATTLNEFVEDTDFSIELNEKEIPIRDNVHYACEILGIDPLYSANEGKIVIIAADEIKQQLLNDLKELEEGKNAAIIGKVTKNHKGLVVLKTPIGGSRILTKLTGAQLPRIC